MGKRGQVTVFVVVGVVILLLVVGYFAVRAFIVEDVFEQRKKELASLPLQAQPVAQYLDGCVQEIGVDALTLIGSQGGLLELEADPIITSPIAPIPKNLEILPGTDLAAPLWFREAPNGVDELNVPSKIEVEDNLAAYLDQNFGRCVANLTAFLNEGYEIREIADFAETEVKVLDNEVQFVVSFPLTFDLKGFSFTLDDHLGRVETQFGQMYDAAVEILESENEGFFLENKTLDMLVAYDDEVPFSGTDLSCSEKVWSKTEVTNRFKAILSENVAAMRIKDTNYDLTIPSQEYLVFDAMDEGREEITVNMMYAPSWPTLIDITPSEGDILRSDPLTKRTSGLVASIVSAYVCLNNHHFVYTIKYPVLFSLTDPQGFTFQYATEVIIDRNLPRENRLLPAALPDTRSPICEYPSAPLQINTYTVDVNANVVPLTGVDLTFKCFPATCDLGAVSERSRVASLNVLAPACVNGFVEARKEGFFTGKTIVATNTQEMQAVDIVLEPVYEKAVEIFVIDKDTGEVREPFSSEIISFEFRHKEAFFSDYFNFQMEGSDCDKEDDCGPGLTCSRSFCLYESCSSDDDCSLDSNCVNRKCRPKDTVDLLIGEYGVTSHISRSSTHPITTQKQVSEKCVPAGEGFLGLFLSEEKCFTTEIPPLELKNALVGGASFEFSFDRASLASSRPLRLYILAEDIPADLEGFANIQTTLDVNKDHPNFRYPEL